MHKSLNEFGIRPKCDNWLAWQLIGLQWEIRRHHVFSNVFDRIHFILAGNNDMHKSLNDSKFGEIRPWTTELAALERLKKSH